MANYTTNSLSQIITIEIFFTKLEFIKSQLITNKKILKRFHQKFQIV